MCGFHAILSKQPTLRKLTAIRGSCKNSMKFNSIDCKSLGALCKRSVYVTFEKIRVFHNHKTFIQK